MTTEYHAPGTRVVLVGAPEWRFYGRVGTVTGMTPNQGAYLVELDEPCDRHGVPVRSDQVVIIRMAQPLNAVDRLAELLENE